MNRPPSHGGTEEFDGLTSHIIRCAINVHRALGPGLLEETYERAMCIELVDEGLRYERQKRIPAFYKGRLLGEYQIDLLVQDLVLSRSRVSKGQFHCLKRSSSTISASSRSGWAC